MSFTSQLNTPTPRAMAGPRTKLPEMSSSAIWKTICLFSSFSDSASGPKTYSIFTCDLSVTVSAIYPVGPVNSGVYHPHLSKFFRHCRCTPSVSLKTSNTGIPIAESEAGVTENIVDRNIDADI